MKKILTHLSGVAFLMAILSAGAFSGCKTTKDKKSEGTNPTTQNDPNTPAAKKNVKIVCFAYELDGELYFEMGDAEGNSVVVAEQTIGDKLKYTNNLTTYVELGDKVTWEWGKDSDVQTFVEIKPSHPNGKIMPKKAEKEDGDKKLKIDVPDEGPGVGDEEGYEIKFLWDEDIIRIDPYLRIKGTRN